MTPRLTDRLVALRHRDYRLLWGGSFLSVLGSQMQLIAINWHIYTLLAGQNYVLTLFGRDIPLGAEALGLGGVGIARAIPIVIFAVLGGTLADAVERRKLMIWSDSIAAILALLLAILSFSGHITVLAIYLLTAAGAAVTAFSSPARQALIPNLVPERDLTNAISLNTTVRQVATIGGPALAGVLISQAEISWIYAFDAVSFGFVIAAVVALNFREELSTRNTGLGIAAIQEGWRYVRGTRIIWSTMLLDFAATFFGSARTLLPLVAGEVLRVGAQGYGILSTAEAVGSLSAGILLSFRRDIYRLGLTLLSGVAIYGVAVFFFGLSTSFALSYFFFALTGVGDTVSMVVRHTIRQVMTPDRLRGRMTGINQIFFMGGPQLGELEAGLVAAAFGAPVAIVTGGIAVLVCTVLVAVRYPKLRNFTLDNLDEERAEIARTDYRNKA